MGQVYLLDTNILSHWASAKSQQHVAVSAAASRLGAGDFLVTSAIVVGEIEYGLQCAQGQNPSAQEELRLFIERNLPAVIPVTRHTRGAYAAVKAALFRKYAKKKDFKGLTVRQLVDPLDGSELHVTENDIWLAAQAIERNCILVSADHHMKTIKELSAELRLENWALPPALPSAPGNCS